MSESPRPQETAGDAGAWPPQLRTGRAFAHATGASGSGLPHRSDSRPPHTPRGARRTGQDGRPGTIPLVPGRPYVFRPLGPRALLTLCALCALLFSLLTWQVADGGPLRTADERLSGAVTGELPGAVPEFFADLGNLEVAAPVLLLVLAATALRARAARTPRWWLPALAGALTLAAVPLLVVPLKALVDRPGPPGTHSPDGFYPSGHTATAAVAYGVAALLLAPLLRTWWRRLLLVCCLLLNVAVGCGLVLRGYHWPLDVVGSWLLCPLLLAAFTAGTALAPFGARSAPR